MFLCCFLRLNETNGEILFLCNRHTYVRKGIHFMNITLHVI